MKMYCIVGLVFRKLMFVEWVCKWGKIEFNFKLLDVKFMVEIFWWLCGLCFFLNWIEGVFFFCVVYDWDEGDGIFIK